MDEKKAALQINNSVAKTDGLESYVGSHENVLFPQHEWKPSESK